MEGARANHKHLFDSDKKPPAFFEHLKEAPADVKGFSVDGGHEADIDLSISDDCVVDKEKAKNSIENLMDKMNISTGFDSAR